MTRTMIALLVTAALILASSVTVPAQGKRGSTPKPQQVSSKGTTTKVSSPKPKAGPKTTQAGPKTSGPKKTTSGSQTAKGPKTTAANGPKTSTAKATGKTKTTSSPGTQSARADAKSATKAAKADTKSTTSEKSSTTSATTTATTPPTTGDAETPVTLTQVQQKLQKNTKLAEKLEGRLPRGTDLIEAAEGFKNLGHFVAAVNVSSNLGLDFDKLKTAMVDDGKSLGQAIQYVKKDVESPTVVAQRAESEALTLIQQTETTTTAPTTTTTTRKSNSKGTPKRTRPGSGS